MHVNSEWQSSHPAQVNIKSQQLLAPVHCSTRAWLAGLEDRRFHLTSWAESAGWSDRVSTECLEWIYVCVCVCVCVCIHPPATCVSKTVRPSMMPLSHNWLLTTVDSSPRPDPSTSSSPARSKYFCHVLYFALFILTHALNHGASGSPGGGISACLCVVVTDQALVSLMACGCLLLFIRGREWHRLPWVQMQHSRGWWDS